ncbi:MATE family efflux transporter [Parabacteroides sp. AM08-6]|uniref:MATE family efflux transporter n=1 Tax=Parabacteroides sp. AM08-6 TaxID=2292053 RepID=UPI000EFDE34B|nr:MATE family efflux transporter [Parabacteroides sp. AM08-6]RHJ86659.1 MATE family efflux transporter [Parabacteroides sp. AM08-6]
MEKDAIDLGTLKVSTLFKKLFIPTLLGMLSISAVTVADGIFVGQGVGSDGIAAVNICIPMFMLFTGIGLMAGVGSSVVVSIHLSRGKIKAARLNVTQALLFVTIITLLFSILMMCFSRQTALLLGASEHLLPMVTSYLLWIVPSLTFQMWIAVSLFIIRLDGAPKLAMWCSVISALINVVLDWLFIFPFGWGVMGAAFATSISIIVGGLIAMIYLLFFARNLRVVAVKWSRNSLRLSLRNIGYQCRIGSSALLSETTLAVLMFTGNLVFMRYLGDDGVGAFGIGCYYIPFVFMVGNAIAQSAQPIISYNFGIGDLERVALTGKISIITALICGVTVMLVFIFCPQVLVGFFLNTADTAARIAIEGFPFFATGFIFFVINLAVIGYYQSLERAKSATFFAILRGFVFLIPCFIFLPKLLGPVGIWLSMPLSEILTTFVIAGFYFRRRDYQVGLS